MKAQQSRIGNVLDGIVLPANALSNATITSEDSFSFPYRGTTFFPLFLTAASQAGDFSIISVTTQELFPETCFVL